MVNVQNHEKVFDWHIDHDNTIFLLAEKVIEFQSPLNVSWETMLILEPKIEGLRTNGTFLK